MDAGADYRAAVGNTIRRLRSERSWSLRALAERSSLSLAYLSEIEHGQKEPSVAALAQLGRAFGLSIPALLSAIVATLEGREPAGHLDAALNERLAGLSDAEIAELIQFAEWLRWRRMTSRAEDVRMNRERHTAADA